MGVTGLWDFLGEGTVVSLAELSSKHFQKEERRYRIAIDEACWRFNNLTDQQVKQIQAKEPRANPVEKAILYRILGLLRLNFTLIFVFDGPGRPWKRGRHGGGKVDYERVRLLKSMLDHFGIQFIVAPGEAEAECARLQRLGVVDAVWSDDGDTLIFGATRLIRSYKESGNQSGPKSKTHVRVTDLKDYSMLVRYGEMIKPAQLILFALFTGGDYDQGGLKGFGAKGAEIFVTSFQGRRLAERLVQLGHKAELHEWRKEAWAQIVAKQGRMIKMDLWPSRRALELYMYPKISSDQILKGYRSLLSGPSKQLREATLYKFLQAKFNFGPLEYTKHVVPILLTSRMFANVQPNADPRGFVEQYRICFKKKRASKKPAGPDADLVRTINFDAGLVSELPQIPSASQDDSKLAEMDALDVLLKACMGDAWTEVPRPAPTPEEVAEAAVRAQERAEAAARHQDNVTVLLNRGKGIYLPDAPPPSFERGPPLKSLTLASTKGAQKSPATASRLQPPPRHDRSSSLEVLLPEVGTVDFGHGKIIVPAVGEIIDEIDLSGNPSSAIRNTIRILRAPTSTSKVMIERVSKPPTSGTMPRASTIPVLPQLDIKGNAASATAAAKRKWGGSHAETPRKHTRSVEVIVID